MQGLLAFLISVGIIFAMPNYLSKFFQSDVLLLYQVVEETTPPNLVKWLTDIKGELPRRQDDSLDLGEKNSKLTVILNSPVAEKLSFIGNKFEKLILKFVNQSDVAVSGASLRIDGILSLWGADAKGTFLGASERAKLLDEIAKGFEKRDMDTAI